MSFRGRKVFPSDFGRLAIEGGIFFAGRKKKIFLQHCDKKGSRSTSVHAAFASTSINPFASKLFSFPARREKKKRSRKLLQTSSCVARVFFLFGTILSSFASNVMFLGGPLDPRFLLPCLSHSSGDHLHFLPLSLRNRGLLILLARIERQRQSGPGRLRRKKNGACAGAE